MYVKIDLTDYTQLQNLDFAPEISFTADTLPINEFTVDIVTDDTIAVNQFAELYDDRDNLWAKYVILKAERLNPSVVQVRAQTELGQTDGVTLDATMYDAEPLSDVMDDVMVRQAGGGLTAGIDYDLDDSLSSITITGFCPQQKARERLQWVLFVAGAYAKTFFNDTIEILPVDETETLIPYRHTFYRPTVNNGEWVTAVAVTAFTFAETTDASLDNSSYRFPLPWTATEQEMSLANNSAPADAPEKVTAYKELYLVNTSNASGILTRLAAFAFNRVEATLDCINNGDFAPGDKVFAYTGKDTLITGYITSAAFRFGKQARASLKLIGVESCTGATLVITYLYNNGRIGRATYYLPVGYTYSIDNPYFDHTYEGRRFIYRPENEAATGTMASGTNTKDEDYQIALEGYGHTLRIVSVDAVEVKTISGAAVGVIS